MIRVGQWDCRCGFRTANPRAMMFHWLAGHEGQEARVVLSPMTPEAPAMNRLDELLVKLRRMSAKAPTFYQLDESDFRELEKAFGLIDAILFEDDEVPADA